MGITARRRFGVLGAIVVVLAGLLASGCGRDPGGQLPQVGGEKLQATREEVTGFGLVRAWADQHEGSLALALEFSQPLVGTQDFDALLQVEPAGTGSDGSGWTLSDDGKVLRYPFVEAARDYTVTLTGTLQAAAGDSLAPPLQKTVHTGELEAAAGFASQGSVLPARESRGLPVVSVNVDEVDVEFLRVREDALPRFFAQFQRGGRRGGWELDNDYGEGAPLRELAEPAYLNRFVLGGERNQRVVSHLPVQDIAELQQPGLYFAVMRRVGRYSDSYDTAFFTVSDIGLHARAYGETMYVHTASLRDGAPLKGVELRVLDAKGQPILKSATDGNGNALLDYRLDAGHVLVARRGKDVSLLPFNQPALDLSEFPVAGRAQAPFDVFAWSGRDLYRPGETLRISALLRDFDGRAMPAPKDGAGQPLFLRLKQPDGRVFRESRLDAGEQGYYAFEQVIPDDAPTGRWQVEFRTGPAKGQAVQGMTLRIEEFLPERLKLDLSTSSAGEALAPGKPLQLRAEAAYLYGAPAAGNRFTARMALAVAREPVVGWPGYAFGDATVDLPRDPRDVLDTEFDANGRLEADLELPEEAARAKTPVKVTVLGEVHESGGRPVSRSLQRVLWPAPALVGVRPLFEPADGAPAESNAGFELVRVDAQGKPQPARGLELTLVRELRDYHWRRDDSGGWNHDFTRRFENVETRKLDAGTSPVRFDVPVAWGEYRIDVFDPATGLTMRYPFHAGWSWGDDNRGADARPDKVKLALDRTAYRAGDTLKVTVTPPQGGRGVLLVESDRLLHVQDIEVRGQAGKAAATFEIPVTGDWERHDVYVTALVFRPSAVDSLVAPARAVGVVHVPMRRDERRVAVGLKVPGQIRPQQDLPVTVSVPQLAGKRAHVTVSAVDAGIINITRFPVPDAAAQFFGQRRLGSDAYDVYGRVIGSYEGGTARLRFGGDMALQALPQARRPTARVQTVDLFSGPVQLDAKGNARLDLPLPDFNGTVRVSALVYADAHYGKRDAEVVVRAPVVAEAGMPRVLAPGDRGTVSLDVQNFSGSAGEFRVRVEGEGPLDVGNGERRIRLEDGAKATLEFPLAARPGSTVAKVRVRVDGGSYVVDRRYDLPVRPAWPGVLRAQTRVLEDGATLSLDGSLAEGLIGDTVDLRLRITTTPPIPYASALSGLLDYPYGCAEQTTSKGYAALLMEPGTAARLGGPSLPTGQRRARVEGAIGRLVAMQGASGHFSMWGGQGDTEPALTPYIAEFLLDAREAGFVVPANALQKALDRLSEDLLSGDPQFYGRDHREHLRFAYRAHAGYVLARVNRAPLGTLRALYDQEKGRSLTGLPLVRLGLALALQGDVRRGDAAIADGFALDPGKRPRWLGDYSSAIRDDALMVALLHERERAVAKFDARAMELSRALQSRRSADGSGRLWLSTQEQMAIARLGRALQAGDGRQVAGQWRAGQVAEEVGSTVFARALDMAALASGARFQAHGGPYYASIEVAGVPRQPPAEDRSVASVRRDWFWPDGRRWSGGTLKEGQVLVARLSVEADQPMPDALVTDLLPAGLEAENLNLGDPAQWEGISIDGVSLSERGGEASIRHEEYRDDRYVAAITLRGGIARLYYLVRAVTPGTYVVPPPQVEDMYQPTLRGTGVARPEQITVTPP
ncbi:alpha-2-macroglobulin domain protein [Pseudoxanthomonas suwonensis 11-1]|uniref:Alpha-2-macroglobulin n=1 Tax=Pseudoxanthomonas suwonensis (strain 11-1) TaxID=743721 RepID=E6WT22_PSEUU|nr:alpha-2-macroglobulin [Pseudoxanthomonas suwonensis]ADV27178.1 alpha-2-macroglobulin domain protein [Pseudoxanthomonas suwonensis 11-1]